MDQNTKKIIHSISEFFFFCFGFIYATGFLMRENNIGVVEFEYLIQITDIPFLFTTLVYFFLSLLLRSEESFLNNPLNEGKIQDFFWIEFFYIFLAVTTFSLYFVIDIFG